MSISTQEQPLSTADLAGMARGNVDQQTTDAKPVAPLFGDDVANEFRTKWDGIQSGFVDEPRVAVQRADELVASAIKRLAERFAEERDRLERQWDRDGEVNTEDLRVALQTYRSFFHRLLSI
jgi:hypothetical protein